MKTEKLEHNNKAAYERGDSKRKNSNLHSAKKVKNDEFYTQLTDIEKELKHYKDHFRDKVVFCNCDDPEESNFWRYFSQSFEHLGLKKLVSTHYERDKPSYKLEITCDKNEDGRINSLDKVITPLQQNGDFRSPECIEIMKEADIIVTNPPFSLFREYLSLLISMNKKFLIIGNNNAVTYKDVFYLIKDNKVWMGISPRGMDFVQADGTLKNVNANWYTNLPHSKRYEDIVLFREYKGNEDSYSEYDNYDAINVDKVADIPKDYAGVMGVPITFLDKYNPNQFDILGITAGRQEFEARPTKKYINPKQVNKDGSIGNGSKANTRSTILLKERPSGVYYVADNANGFLKICYARILIKHKNRT